MIYNLAFKKKNIYINHNVLLLHNDWSGFELFMCLANLNRLFCIAQFKLGVISSYPIDIHSFFVISITI